VGFLNKLQPLGLLALRIVLGVIMAAHGWQKIHGGADHFAQMVHGLGMPGWFAYLSIAAEFLGGIFLMFGFLTRFAAGFVLIDMLVAIFTVHLHKGLTGQGGKEFPLSLATMAFTLLLFGAGEMSIDWLVGARGK
jgi:putative oxidoreductase